MFNDGKTLLHSEGECNSLSMSAIIWFGLDIAIVGVMLFLGGCIF